MIAKIIEPRNSALAVSPAVIEEIQVSFLFLTTTGRSD